MERKTYLKKHFASEKEICDKLNALHAAYVRICAAKGRKKETLSVSQLLHEDSGKVAERKRIFDEIDRLVRLGNSIPKAIEIMRRGTYEGRMRGVKPETWRRYYTKYVQEKKLRKRRNETINETIKRVIQNKSGISGIEIVEVVSKSRATVMRALASLKKSGEVVYCGSRKTGGYHIDESLR